MKIRKIEVSNYKSLKDIIITPSDLFALVGRNNSGKSNVISALKLFFDGTVKGMSEETFYNKDQSKPIKIIITFEQLSAWEKTEFGSWLNGNQLIVGREFSANGNGGYSVSSISIKSVPDVEWLNEGMVSGDKIKDWWNDKANLKINGKDFGATLGGTRPNVGEWKTCKS
ncbi:MAG: AAA family ATPase [Candidatus Marinimicrobia bacterium]|nr:AAA family ATPase [Candidatus Neomarinimicrobiota bacterium]